MALAETIEYDKIEVVTEYCNVQVRKRVVIKKDGVEVASNYERYILHAGTLNDKNELVDTDLTSEPAKVKAICNAVWTTDVKNAWKAKLIADKSKS